MEENGPDRVRVRDQNDCFSAKKSMVSFTKEVTKKEFMN